MSRQGDWIYGPREYFFKLPEQEDTSTRLAHWMQRPPDAPAKADDLERLILRAQRGDKEAFGEIYRHMYPAVGKFIYYKIGDRSVVEDLSNDVFLAAWRSLPNFRGGPFEGWLFRIARNLTVGEIRRRSKNRPIGIEGAEDLPAADDEPDIAAEKLDRARDLYQALDKLKEEQKEVVILKFLLGMSNSEAAAALGKSENAINAQQHRALRSLERVLRKQGALDD